MKFTSRDSTKEDDFWNTRNLLRDIFLLNDSQEHSWHVARLDYWRWHFIKTCNIMGSAADDMAIWENAKGKEIAALDGSIAAFCTIFYDDYTRSAVTVLVGTAYEHWRRGLGKAIIIEGLQRLKAMGCKFVFATAHDKPADGLYRSVMHEMKITNTWVKIIT